MQRRSFLLRAAPLLLSLGLSACGSLAALGLKQGDGLGQVDELLGHVDRLQVEAAVSKQRAQTGLEGLRKLLAPEFKGDPAAAHAEYVATVEASEDQAEALQDSVRPLRKTGERVFTRWTADLESFGNISMRQRSQDRLEETRRRFDAILAAAVSAQLAYDGFNGDLSDHALFLEHDFNSASVAMISGELDGLRSRGKELGRRLDACIAACQAYVEFSAPGPKEPAEAAPAVEEQKEVAPAPAPAPAPATKAPVKKRVLPRATPQSGQGG